MFFKSNRWRYHIMPAVMTFFGLILLLSLGSWQLYRLQWKNDLINTLNNHLSSPGLTEDAFNSLIAENKTYKKISLEGEIDSSKSPILLYTVAVQFRGSAGYRRFIRFVSDSGNDYLVDIGWVSESKKQSPLPNFTKKSLQFISLPEEKASWFIPDNRPDLNQWIWIELPKMYQSIGMKPEKYYLLYLDNETKNFLQHIRNDHLSYAITWYGAAMTLAVIYYMYRRKYISEVK